MGTSNWQNISYNIELIRKLDPMSILDIGVGFGRWGILFREFLEIWENSRYDGNWERIIDGVEIHKNYIKDYHKYFYSNIYIADAKEFLETTLNTYDLINFGDVLEHFNKSDGEKLLSLSIEKAKYVLINIPIGKHWQQQGTDENPFEEHKSVWYNNDFTKYKNHIIKTFYDFTHRQYSVVLISKNKISFTDKFGKYFKVKNFLKHRLGLKKIIEMYEKNKR
jgi:hypothetical protein